MDIQSLLARASEVELERFPWGEIRWLISGATDPGATMTVGVCRIDPGRSNPLHHHPNCDEVLYVLSGRWRKQIGDSSMKMGPDDVIRIPRGERHRAETISDEPMTCLIAYDTARREAVFLEDIA
ncbi:MAG: cupin domain-containing protein [Dehalococcoidia bacterium]